ncbi:hypothetical protein A2803_03925 [Candidatus Woesebacteria bacterium RIFCSPHIGHO2_01_FULL_44_21]|uniref:Uncharacterized protein n=1 Tax=Candidatus Woesebacteria bacterium RIFCSPHIGHO2_01_FULL_44_21 TaxID=1802503 RepID=A0A1F7YVG2_9BACT|nr:MAG: hypothetical protein A2803_03925 [Candidatus Woesebacteria bacterium RIFCSPHIGHO2_01_FULL_44_21]
MKKLAKVLDDYAKFYRSNKCIICKKPIVKYFKKRKSVLYDDFSKEVTIYECTNCNLGYTYPFISQSKLVNLYKNYAPVGQDDKLKDSPFLKLFKFINFQVFQTCLKSDNITLNKIITSCLFQGFFQTFPIFSNQTKKPLEVLDVGCGSGFFLTMAKHTGCNVYGIEIDKDLVRKLKKSGINTYSSLEQIKKLNKKFDLIRFNHVLEHLTDPNHDLKYTCSLLKKRGELIIGVPSYNTPARLFGKYMIMHIPFHRLHMSKSAVELLVKNSGFKISYRRTKSCGMFTWSFLRMLRLDTSKYRYPIRLLEMFTLSIFFDLLKIGDSQEIYATK